MVLFKYLSIMELMEIALVRPSGFAQCESCSLLGRKALTIER